MYLDSIGGCIVVSSPMFVVFWVLFVIDFLICAKKKTTL